MPGKNRKRADVERLRRLQQKPNAQTNKLRPLLFSTDSSEGVPRKCRVSAVNDFPQSSADGEGCTSDLPPPVDDELSVFEDSGISMTPIVSTSRISARIRCRGNSTPSTPFLSRPTVTNARESRRHSIQQKNLDKNTRSMDAVQKNYFAQPWPLKPNITRPVSSVNRLRCRGGNDPCKCTPAACQQNAAAFVATSAYDAHYHQEKIKTKKLANEPSSWCHSRLILGKEHIKCASIEANHKVDYYDSGDFGAAFCPFCGERWLKGEWDEYGIDDVTQPRKKGKKTFCCSDGECHTAIMKKEFAELMNPPPTLQTELVGARDVRLRDQYLNNTIAINNSFAFASVCGVEKAPAALMGGRMDTCKVNGMFSFLLYDLIPPNALNKDGRRDQNKKMNPKFAQTYMLNIEDSTRIRIEDFPPILRAAYKQEILQRVEQLMASNPYSRTFRKVGEIMGEEETAHGELPHFRILLLKGKQLRDELANGREDFIIRRVEEPTADQVAVVWLGDEGLPPDLPSIVASDHAGRKTIIDDGDPLVDPLCFPLLHPKGTFGWRPQMLLRSFEDRDEDQSNVREIGEDQNVSQDVDILNDSLQNVELLDEETGNAIQIAVDTEQFTAYVGDQHANQEEEEIVDEVNVLDADTTNQLNRILPDGFFFEPNDSIAVGGEAREIYEEAYNANNQQSTSANLNSLSANDETDGCFPVPVQKIAESRRHISQRQFYKYRMAMRMRTREDYHWLYYSRKLSEYFCISVLNRVERRELEFLKMIQRKKSYRRIRAKEFLDAIERGLHKMGPNRKLGNVYTLPQTFAGSRQYYQSKYADLMTIVQKLGNPTWFITFTGNPKWPEITRALGPGQDYTHRFDITDRIFLDKAREFIKDVVERQVMGDVAGWCVSVEHQKRGVPHLHMLLILKKNCSIKTPEQVDQYVSARIPPLPPMDDLSDEANQQRRLYHYVTTMMLHECSKACKEHPQDKCRKHFPKPFSSHTEISDVHYTKYIRVPPEQAYETVLPTRGLVTEVDGGESNRLMPSNDAERDWAEVRLKRLPPKERRFGPQRIYEECGLIHVKCRGRNLEVPLDDSFVIPYNPHLLLRFGCHINVEYVFGQKACKYIFKYLLKGFEKGFVRIHQKRRGQNTAGGPQIYDYDEMIATFKVRYMTAMEAYLRLHSNRIVTMKHSIYKLSVHNEKEQTILIEEGNEDMAIVDKDTYLTAFFKLCSVDKEAQLLTYDRVPYKYRWLQKERKWQKRKYPICEDPEKASMFVRVYSVSPKNHELFALRVLLLNRPGPKSFENLRTIDGVVYFTFTEAAQKLDLLESDEIYVGAMHDACSNIMSDKRLQQYFAMLLLHCTPSDPERMLDLFLDQLSPQMVPANVEPKTVEFRKNEVLRNLEYFLRCMGSDCRSVGLSGAPADYNHEVVGETLEHDTLLDDFYGREQTRAKSHRAFVIDQLKKLNADQRVAFQKIKSAVLDDNQQKLFFLEGSGGCGKTFLYNMLIRWCLAGCPDTEISPDFELDEDELNKRLNPEYVISTASTGIAALLLVGGSTVHRSFCVPNDVDVDTDPMISPESKKGQFIKNAKLIIIDEISMLSRIVLQYLDKLLRDVCGIDLPFGGKVVMLGGDWKQLCPVVEHGTREDQVAESIKSDELFMLFEKLSLTINMRTEESEKKLRDWLVEIGNGATVGEGNTLHLKMPNEIVANELDDVINFCFPYKLFDDPLNYSDAVSVNAILCPTNADVEEINEIAIEKMQGKEEVFHSIDEPLESADNVLGYRADFNVEALNKEMPTGFPPHILKLKVGSPIMLLRNLDISQGLVNGTRLQIHKISDHNLICRILTGPKADAKSIALIPRVKFEYGRGRRQRGIRFRRLQFPVRLCFAMTVNKAQGQTLKRMGLVLRNGQCFSHGQVYVAFSRVTSLDGLKVFSPDTCRGTEKYIKNVVYHELFGTPIVCSGKTATRNLKTMSLLSTSNVLRDYTDSDIEPYFD